MGNDRYRTVVRILAENRGEDASTIEPTTRLYEDLGLYGGDAEELFNALEESCGRIDWARLDFRRYFGDECGGFWPWQQTEANRSPSHPVTVAHLAAVVEAGAWFDPS